MSVVTSDNCSAGSKNSPLHIVLATTRTAAETLRKWRHNYRSRRELASYSYSERSDLSLLTEVDAEICKPFWKK